MRKYLDKHQIDHLLTSISSNRDRALFTLMYWRGMRASEPLMILRRDVDLDAGTIDFERLKHSTGGRYDLQVPELDALRAWLADSKCPAGTNARIFGITRAQVWSLFRRYALAIGLPEDLAHPHTLKHSIATHLLDAGVDIVDVQDWLGHKSIQNTMIYAAITSSRRRSAAAAMRTKLGGISGRADS